MSKTNLFLKYLKNISNFINSLLEKNLNKLNFKNHSYLIKNNKIIFTFVALFVLFISYLLIPTFFKQSQISNQLKKEIFKNYNININFNNNLNYNFFPRPHFTNKDSNIFYKNEKISNIKKIKIFVSLDKLLSLKNIEVNDLSIEKANFNLNKNNYNFFTNLLNNNFTEKNLTINNSNIFFRNEKDEVLFINQILNLNYFYDLKYSQNKFTSENEIFNVPYSIELFKNNVNNIFYSKINLNFLKLQIENQLNSEDNMKSGKASIIYNKLKSNIDYNLNNSFFEFDFYDKLENPEFSFNGKFNLNPFYATLNGNSIEFNSANFFNSESFFIQLLKTEIFNSQNIDFEFNLKSNYINNYPNFKNINFNSKIKDGLIDLDNTSFNWKKFANFKIYNSLLFVNEGELLLDGKLEINIANYNEIYKFLLTPKNFRNKFSKLDLGFSYNFNQQNTKLKDIKIDGKMNNELNKIFGNIELKDNNLHNKIYFKNLLNQAIKAYAG